MLALYTRGVNFAKSHCKFVYFDLLSMNVHNLGVQRPHIGTSFHNYQIEMFHCSYPRTISSFSYMPKRNRYNSVWISLDGSHAVISGGKNLFRTVVNYFNNVNESLDGITVVAPLRLYLLNASRTLFV